MGQVWTFEGAPATTMGAPSGLITLLDGTTFCICESSGDVRHGGAQGLFVRDTRLISRLELSINGHVPEPLAPQAREPFALHVPEQDAAAARPRRQHDAGGQAPGAERRHERRDHACAT